MILEIVLHSRSKGSIGYLEVLLGPLGEVILEVVEKDIIKVVTHFIFLKAINKVRVKAWCRDLVGVARVEILAGPFCVHDTGYTLVLAGKRHFLLGWVARWLCIIRSLSRALVLMCVMDADNR